LNTMSDAKPVNDCSGCKRVRRRDNRSKRKSSRQGKSRHNRVCDPGNRNHRRQHRTDCEQEYWSQITPKITPRCEQRRRIKKCRKNEIEYGVRIEFHLRQSRHETQAKSANDEYDRIRERNSAREHSENRYQSEQKNNDLSLVHDQLPERWSSGVMERWNFTTPAPQYSFTPLGLALHGRDWPEAQPDVFPTSDKGRATAPSRFGTISCESTA